jgi:soluble lytic murein transglycosylase-like protein
MWTQAVALGLLLGFVASPVFGEIYMYRDKRGVLHFSNAPTQPDYRYHRSEVAPPAQGWQRASFNSIGGKRREAYDPIIRDAAERHGIEEALVKAVIRVESDFRPDAVSPKGARGLMQLMPATARMRNVWSVFEPSQNIEGGVKHLRYLLDRYSGNLRLALAAYNAGEGAVDRNGGVPPYRETWDYLTRVLGFREASLRQQ